eukprot:1336549-Rhodomonas_salina.1
MCPCARPPRALTQALVARVRVAQLLPALQLAPSPPRAPPPLRHDHLPPRRGTLSRLSPRSPCPARAPSRHALTVEGRCRMALGQGLKKPRAVATRCPPVPLPASVCATGGCDVQDRHERGRATGLSCAGLRAGGGRRHPDDFASVRYLWRGLKNVGISEELERRGGTELALMSTSASLDVACRYAKSARPLIVRCHALGLGRGCSIKYLSVFPMEDEYLYPPLTYLAPRKMMTWEELCRKDAEVARFTASLDGPDDAGSNANASASKAARAMLRRARVFESNLEHSKAASDSQAAAGFKQASSCGHDDRPLTVTGPGLRLLLCLTDRDYIMTVPGPGDRGST